MQAWACWRRDCLFPCRAYKQGRSASIVSELLEAQDKCASAPDSRPLYMRNTSWTTSAGTAPESKWAFLRGSSVLRRVVFVSAPDRIFCLYARDVVVLHAVRVRVSRACFTVMGWFLQWSECSTDISSKQRSIYSNQSGFSVRQSKVTS